MKVVFVHHVFSYLRIFNFHKIFPLHCQAVFGEGFCWAGCAFIHLLGLRERFEVLDFTYFIMSINPIGQDRKNTKVHIPLGGCVLHSVQLHCILESHTFLVYGTLMTSIYGIIKLSVVFWWQKTPEQEILPSLEFLLTEGESVRAVNDSVFSILQVNYSFYASFILSNNYTRRRAFKKSIFPFIRVHFFDMQAHMPAPPKPFVRFRPPMPAASQAVAIQHM